MNKKVLFLIISIIILQACDVNIDSAVSNTSFGLNALKYEFIIVLISLSSGILCLIGGVVLTILGFTGDIDWIIETGGFTSRLTNASPGIILMIIGLIIVIKSRVKIKNK